ncbi:MAG: DUF3322 domain-containing protein [Actinoallomurus sp.]
MRQPDLVRADLRRRFEKSFPEWALGQGSWPLRIPLHPPAVVDRASDPLACLQWAQQWKEWDLGGVVEFESAQFPTGRHELPRRLTLDTPGQVAALSPDTDARWRLCGQRLITLKNNFPGAFYTGVIRKITDLEDVDFRRLVDAVAWLRANPTSGLLVRQLPIEGLDTKWLERHAHLVLSMLGDHSAPDLGVEAGPGHGPGAQDPHGHNGDSSGTDGDAGRQGSRRKQLLRRLGLRIQPEEIRVAVLDPMLREQVCGMRHFAAPVADLNQWQLRPDTVIICENKETGYAFTQDLPRTVVLHGQGFSVASYADITWVASASTVVYWGDIDNPGLEFVNDLRKHGVDAQTALMDIATLNRFRHLAVAGSGPGRAAVSHLTPVELSLYDLLTDHAAQNGQGLLLEQERISWPYAYDQILNVLSTSSTFNDVGRQVS